MRRLVPFKELWRKLIAALEDHLPTGVGRYPLFVWSLLSSFRFLILKETPAAPQSFLAPLRPSREWSWYFA
jgi:hypothetical protein